MIRQWLGLGLGLCHREVCSNNLSLWDSPVGSTAAAADGHGRGDGPVERQGCQPAEEEQTAAVGAAGQS